ncbi:hypothetical protein ACFX2F_016934 [Malus domestica]
MGKTHGSFQGKYGSSPSHGLALDVLLVEFLLLVVLQEEGPGLALTYSTYCPTGCSMDTDTSSELEGRPSSSQPEPQDESASYRDVLYKNFNKDLGSSHMFPERDHRLIYRVPERFCRGNEESYRPRVVSIGPYHYKSLRSASIKLYYALSFTERYMSTSTSPTGFMFVEVLEELAGKWAGKWVEKARTYYSESVELSNDDFALMMVVDGAFLLELMLRSRFPKFRSTKVADPIFHRTRILVDVCRDILLIENQLPWFVLDKLYRKLVLPHPPPDEKEVNLERLAHDFFKAYLVDNNNIGNRIPATTTDGYLFLDKDTKDHLAALVRWSFYSPSEIISSPISDGDLNITVELIPPSVTALHEAGVRFEKLIPTSFGLEIKFDRGSLKIPYLDYRTGTHLLNLMVFEENSDFPPGGNYVSQYMFFMGCMIRTSKDVNIPIESGIISNTLGSNRDLVALFDRISKMGWPHAYFSLCKQLNDYRTSSPWHKWAATLKRDYLDTPWKTASTIAAVILLILTIMQTVCSFLSLKP